MDGVVREVYARAERYGVSLMEVHGQGWELCQILLADDTALAADSQDKLQELVEEFSRVCERRKLKVNVLSANRWGQTQCEFEWRDV